MQHYIIVCMCRTNDGSQQWAQLRFAPINTVGAYQPTPNQTAALYPQLASTNTWVTPRAADFVPQQFANLTYAPVGSRRISPLLQLQQHVRKLSK